MEPIRIDPEASTPIYRQLIDEIRNRALSGAFPVGSQLPSINQFSAELSVSKDTVKKAYAILRKEGFVRSSHGKGFFISTPSAGGKMNLIFLIDKISPLKQSLFHTFSATIGDRAELTIKIHNQDPDLLEHYLDESLDRFDYYLVSPHFPLDEEIQARVLKQLGRIPNRKLILIDRQIPALAGNYGAVYQDYNQDIYEALGTCVDRLREFARLNVVTVPESLYGSEINAAVKRFCKTYRIKANYLTNTTPKDLRKNEVYLLLNSQLDTGLMELVRNIRNKGYTIGKDIAIISYNESPISELVLGGLTTVSTDFSQMGLIAAEMVLSGDLHKTKCDFRVHRRSTF